MVTHCPSEFAAQPVATDRMITHMDKIAPEGRYDLEADDLRSAMVTSGEFWWTRATEPGRIMAEAPPYARPLRTTA